MLTLTASCRIPDLMGSSFCFADAFGDQFMFYRVTLFKLCLGMSCRTSGQGGLWDVRWGFLMENNQTGPSRLLLSCEWGTPPTPML